MRRAARWLLAFVLVVLVALVLGTLVPRPLVGRATGEEGGTIRILVLASPIHTDIAIPVEAVAQADFAFLGESGLPIGHPGVRWVMFGWGGKAFYVATPEMTDIQVGPLLRSFTLDSSVMHVQLVGPLDEQQPGIGSFEVSEANLGRLLAFARATFAEPNGKPIRLEGTGYGQFDTFFEATGSFNAFLGCNTWTAAALREAGLRTGWWNPMPQTLVWSLELYNR
jgi:uncharacterized protein (TIGR02117 family)